MLFFIAVIISYEAAGVSNWKRSTLNSLCETNVFQCDQPRYGHVIARKLSDFDILRRAHNQGRHSLRIYLNDKTGFCLEDDTNVACNGMYRFPKTGPELQGFKNFYVYGPLAYVNKSAFYELFPDLTKIVIVGASFKEITIPITKKSLNEILLNANNNLENIMADQNMLPIENSFEVKNGSSILEAFQVGPINVGLTMRHFQVDANADAVQIALPRNTAESTISYVVIAYYGNNPDNVKLSYENMKGKISSIKFMFANKPNSMKDLWPPIGAMTEPITIKMISPATKTWPGGRQGSAEPYDISGHKYVLQEWTFQNDIEEERKLVARQEDSSSLKLMSKSSPLKVTEKIENQVIVDFIIADIATIMQSTSDNTKEYTVNTYFLVLHDMYSDGSLQLVTNVIINYQMLVVSNYSRFFGFKLEVATGQFKTIQFTKAVSIINIWKPFTVEIVYSMITGLVNAIKPSFESESESFTAIRSGIANKLFDEIDVKRVKQLFSTDALSDNSYHYLHSAMKKINELKLFFNTYGKKARRLPRLSPALYKEKTLIYHEMAKSLLERKKSSDVNAGQKILLEISNRKSQTEKNIAAEQQKLLEKRVQDSSITLQKLKSQRLKYEQEYKDNSNKFNAAVKRRQAQAVLEAVMGVFGAIMSVFSGGIGAISQIGELSGAITKLVKTIKKIQKLIARITTIISTLSGLVNDVMATYNNINIVQEGFNPNFDPSKIDDVVNKVSNLNAADVLEWDIAAKQVEGMMDASLSAEIPETLSYKTAILKMVTAGKAETEASIEFVQLKSEVYMNKYKMDAYDSEIKFIKKAKKTLTSSQNKQQFDKNLKLSTMQLKLDLFLHIIDYCDSSFYYNLQPCFAYSEFSFDDSLSQVMYISNKILAESIANMNDLFPPPQSFRDKSIKLSINEGCTNTITQYEQSLSSDVCSTDLSSSDCKNVLQRAFGTLTTVNTPDDEQSRLFYAQLNQIQLTSIDKDIVKFQRIYLDCLSSNVQELKTTNETSISISLDSEDFQRFDRVRIEVLNIILHGAKLKSEFLEVEVENQGVVEDRLNGKTFVFMGDKWNRIIRYNSSSSGIKYEVKGDVDEEFARKFNNPTPFSTWRISVSKENNPGLDLTGLTTIELLFSGSFMKDQIKIKPTEAPTN